MYFLKAEILISREKLAYPKVLINSEDFSVAFSHWIAGLCEKLLVAGLWAN